MNVSVWLQFVQPLAARYIQAKLPLAWGSRIPVFGSGALI
jgi:hypothetical protein